MNDREPAGGFVPPGILSPPLSPHTVSSTSGPSLPPCRAHPLKPGGTKESNLIRFLDSEIYKIQRRYANRNTKELGIQGEGAANGYEHFLDVEKDMERLIDLIWVCGTPSLQIPYLLNLAVLVKDYLPSFPPAPKATFRIIGKLDLAFASLLQGRHADTGEALPGFETGRNISGTEKVRIKSVVDRTRVVVAEVLEGVDEAPNDLEDDYSDLDMELEEENEDMEVMSDCEMGIAKVYDRTIVELGDTLGGTPIGIISDD